MLGFALGAYIYICVHTRVCAYYILYALFTKAQHIVCVPANLRTRGAGNTTYSVFCAVSYAICCVRIFCSLAFLCLRVCACMLLRYKKRIQQIFHRAKKAGANLPLLTCPFLLRCCQLQPRFVSCNPCVSLVCCVYAKCFH